MATVRISSELHSAVYSNINAMCDAQVVRDAGNEPGNIAIDPYDPRILQALFGEQWRKMVECPSEWFPSRGDIGVRIEVKNEQGNIIKTCRPDFISNKPGIPFRVSDGRSYPAIRSSPAIDISTPEDFERWPEAAKHRDYWLARNDIEGEWLKVRQQVHSFLSQFATLNQAVKAWEGVRLYIPQNFLDRLDAKVERTKSEIKAELAVANIDVSKLTTMAVGARLGF